MQILPISYINKTRISNPSRAFKGRKQEFVPITSDSFRKETGKKLYSQIQKYFKLIENGGSIKNHKIMHEKGNYYLHTIEPFDYEAEILLTLNKNNKNSNILLYKKYLDGNKGEVLLEATLDKDGQMISGQFPPDCITFERSKGNVRRIRYKENTFLPVGGNDREWDCNGDRLPIKFWLLKEDDSTTGAYEIFLGLAQLKTSVFK